MTRWIISGVLLIALIATGIWGYNQYMENENYKTYMDNLYQKSFYELVGHVGNIETRLSKMMVSGDQGQNMVILSDVWRQADAAGEDLGELPLSHLALDKTYKFLNQLADYCYYLTKKVGEGKTLSLEEMKNLQELHNSCVDLNNDLRVLENQVNEGKVSWGQIRQRGNKKLNENSGDIISKQFTNIEQTTIEYPTLIYDGPFSETLEKKDKVTLTGPNINQEKARDIAAQFVGKDRVKEVSDAPQGKGDIETWGVYVQTKGDDGPFYVAVTKKGGKVVSMVADGGRRQSRISIDEAQKRATQFLEKRGYSKMAPTYQQHYDGVAVINFAYKDKGVVIYPDLIKVKIALDNGQVVGFEGRNYLIAHKDREIKEPKLSLEEARKLVSPALEVESARLAIIPKESGREVMCYEFKGKYGGEMFIVYLNANTGNEENILKIINSENGTLIL